MLAGVTALVTGASRGIGLATVQSLASCGARVVMLARNRAVLEAEAASIGPSAIVCVCDLADARDTDRAITEMLQRVGPPSILVNNAGAFALGRVGEYAPADFEQMFAVNTFGPFRLLHALVSRFREQGRGHVVTVGSVADAQAFPENAAYAATKFGMRAVHEVLREELRGTGVRTSLVSPGPVDTGLWDSVALETRSGFPSREQMLNPGDVADAIAWVVTRPAHVNVDEMRLARA